VAVRKGLQGIKQHALRVAIRLESPSTTSTLASRSVVAVRKGLQGIKQHALRVAIPLESPSTTSTLASRSIVPSRKSSVAPRCAYGTPRAGANPPDARREYPQLLAARTGV